MKTQARKQHILRPGNTGWELWTMRPGVLPSCEIPTMQSAPPRLVATIPTRNLVALPLWLPTSGDTRELAELELSSRHLLRRGMEVVCVPLEVSGARTLVLAMACEEPAAAPGMFHAAARYEAAPRLWPADGADVAIWREENSLCFALYRKGACVFFAGGAGSLRILGGALKRTLLRLRAEQILDRAPQRVKLYGIFPEEERKALIAALGLALEYHEEVPPPRFMEPATDLPTPSVRERRSIVHGRRRLLALAASVAVAYLAVAGVFGGLLAYESWQVAQLRTEAESLEIPASAARGEAARWREIRSAIDPRVFALDLLAAVAAQLPSDQVRLTVFSLESGRILIEGEAPTVPEAYAFVENVRKCPALSEFDWTAGQPQLAGKKSVRFEMEGRSADAKVVEE
jgi:hypothetical protein